MKLGLVTLRNTPSFRNQADLIYKVAVQHGWEVDYRHIDETVGYPRVHWDRLIALIPLWPRYIFAIVRLTSPWMSRTHVVYGPVDGPFQRNINLFEVMKNLNIVVPSKWCQECVARSGTKVKAVIPHGINHEDFVFPKTEKYSRLKQLRAKYPNRTILFSNLNPLHRKGFFHLQKELEILSKRLPEKFIVILHTGLARAKQINPSIEKTPNLIIEDAYNKLPFRAVALKTVSCDVYVHPALLEGFGLPILEAMASKRTIVCLDAPPMNELVSEKEAWLFPYHTIREEKWGNGSIAQLHEYNPEDLAFAMEQAILEKEESQARAESAYEKSLNYDYRKVYPEILKV